MKRFFFCSARGRRRANEDRFDYILGGDTDYLGVYDGHGGSRVASRLSRGFLRRWVTTSDPQKSIYQLERGLRRGGEDVGSTLVACKVDKRKGVVKTVNVGDSRAVLVCADGTAVDLTVDHKPSAELSRLREAGASVEYDASDDIARVEGFGLSRAVGDTAHPFLTSAADTAVVNYGHLGGRYLVLASDGLWDVADGAEVASVLSERPPGGQGNLAEVLVRHALKRGSQDNVTVLLYEL